MQVAEKVTPTLLARDFYDPISVRTNGIVRRLTPTEYARLQGFPDKWGHLDTKENLTDDEYKFWLDVRNTYASINGKQTKNHSKEQMLKWYNSLHTDRAEYKMWGNGIALPTALYCLDGISSVLEEENEC
jgi:DNA (cytosine-5)-methyltransferase 1